MHGVPEMKPRIDAEGTDLGYGLSSFGSSTGKGWAPLNPCFVLYLLAVFPSGSRPELQCVVLTQIHS